VLPLEIEPIEASLLDPDDPVETNILAHVAGVGRTNRLSTGQVVTWTADKLRRFAPTMVGMPINVDLDEEGEPTGHSRHAVGAITSSEFDETTQTVKATGSVWRHYFPSVAESLKSLFSERGLPVSMEFVPTAELQSNADGSVTPTEGRFSGLGIVKTGADPRAYTALMAATQEDLERRPVEVSMNLDQITEIVARRLGHRSDNVDAATRTQTDDATPAESEEVQASEDQDAQESLEGEATLAELTDEMRASLREELLAELQPAIDAANARAEAAEKALADREADDAAKALVASRMDELDAILPTDEKNRAGRQALVATLDDAAFAGLKAELAAAAEIKGGIATDAEEHEDTEGELSADERSKLVKEALAGAGYAATAKAE